MPTVECHTCGEPTEKPQWKIDRNDRLFCSRECYHKAGRPDMRGENNPNGAKERVSLACEHCGEEFEVYPYRADSARFCSRECKNDFMKGKSGKATPAYKGSKEMYTCENCGKEFEEYPYRNDGRYCSERCYREASRDLFAGENNPVWRGGRVDYYGPNWEEQREKALDRDNHTCQQCGTPADDMSRSPDVHHKKRLGWFKEEYDSPEWYERGNRLDNLVTLCPSCHMKETWSIGELSNG